MLQRRSTRVFARPRCDAVHRALAILRNFVEQAGNEKFRAQMLQRSMGRNDPATELTGRLRQCRLNVCEKGDP
jgi:hypothetical protein